MDRIKYYYEEERDVSCSTVQSPFHLHSPVRRRSLVELTHPSAPPPPCPFADSFLCRLPPQPPPTPSRSMGAMLALWNRSLESLAPSQQRCHRLHRKECIFHILAILPLPVPFVVLIGLEREDDGERKLRDDATRIREGSRESPREISGKRTPDEISVWCLLFRLSFLINGCRRVNLGFLFFLSTFPNYPN